MVLSAIRQQKTYSQIQIVPHTDPRLNAQCVIVLSSTDGTTHIATVKSFKHKVVYHNGQPVREEWAKVLIPGVGRRCIPPSYFICWTW